MTQKQPPMTDEATLHHTLTYYLHLYTDSEGGYVAEIKDLPGCITQGDTLEEAIENIAEAKELWLETVYESGRAIPLPTTELQEDRTLMQVPTNLVPIVQELIARSIPAAS